MQWLIYILRIWMGEGRDDTIWSRGLSKLNHVVQLYRGLSKLGHGPTVVNHDVLMFWWSLVTMKIQSMILVPSVTIPSFWGHFAVSDPWLRSMVFMRESVHNHERVQTLQIYMRCWFFSYSTYVIIGDSCLVIRDN